MSKNLKIIVQDSPQACANYLQERLVKGIQATIDAKGRCVIALSGGSTPKLLYEGLAKLPSGVIDWSKVILVWGDERDVPPNDSNSNYRMVKLALLDHLPTGNQPQVLRIPTGDMTADKAANEYEVTLRELSIDGKSVLDISLLGLGDDAHTASLFPGTTALSVQNRWVVANWVEKLNTWRVTLSYDALNGAASTYFLVCGASKTAALRHIWSGPMDIKRFPAGGIEPASDEVYWIVDKAAVAGLEHLVS